MEPNRPIVHKQEIVLENPWFKVRHDTLTWPNGTPGEYNVIEFPEGVIIISIKDDQILVLKQFRYPVQEYSTEFVGGGIKPGHSPMQAAQLELKEETGYHANNLEEIGFVYSLKGLCHLKLHVFVASDLQAGTQALEPGEFDVTVKWIRISEWQELISTNQITNEEALAAWCLYQSKKQ